MGHQSFTSRPRISSLTGRVFSSKPLPRQTLRLSLPRPIPSLSPGDNLPSPPGWTLVSLPLRHPWSSCQVKQPSPAAAGIMQLCNALLPAVLPLTHSGAWAPPTVGCRSRGSCPNPAWMISLCFSPLFFSESQSIALLSLTSLHTCYSYTLLWARVG